MKKNILNLLAFLGVLHFADQGTQAGAGATGTYSPETIFASLKDWKPSQFREAVSPELARSLVMPTNRNTLLHQAIEVGNVDIVRMLINKPYALDPKVTNGVGETAVDAAREKGGEFLGIFKDIGDE